MSEVVELRSLEIGDRFISAKENNKRNPIRYKVDGKSEFNIEAGTATRRCINENKKEYCNKQSKLKVIKLPIK